MNFNKSLFKTYLIYFIVIVCFVALRIFASLGAFKFVNDAFWQGNVSTIFIQVLIMGVLPVTLFMLLFKKGPKQTFNKLGFKKISLKAVLLCVAIGVLVYILNVIVANIFGFILSMFGYSSGSGSGGGYSYDSFFKFLMGTVFVAVLPAVFEEITHRGILMRGVATNAGYKKAIIISSVMFGLMHLNVAQCFYAIFIGIIIGFVSSISDSIYPAIILHFMNNFINVYFSYAETCNLPGANLFNNITKIMSNMNIITCFLTFLLVLLVVCCLLAYLIFLLFKETRNKQISKSIIKVASIVNETNEEELKEEQVITSFQQFVMPYMKNQDLIDAMLPKVENYEKKHSLKTNIFKICTLFIGCLITIFTFIWGIL